MNLIKQLILFLIKYSYLINDIFYIIIFYFFFKDLFIIVVINEPCRTTEINSN